MNTPIKVLFIEDDELDRDALFQMVQEKQLPYDMTAVETLAQARARLAESHFDIILADYHLPDGPSTELFAEVSNTPFILMTGTLDEELALRTLQRGADDYLPKDRQQHHLEAVPLAVEKVLHRHRLRGIEERLTRELREQDRRTRLAQQATGVGTFEWDIPSNRVTWSPELERLYGLPPGGFGGRYETWLACVHPEDRPETERQHERALATGRMQAEWRVVWSDGTVHWIAGRATVEMDSAGRPLRMLGVNVDITDRKQAEEALRQSEERLRRALDYDQAVMANMGEGLYTLDVQERVTYVNPAAERLLGWSSAELLGRKMHKVIHYKHPDGRPFPPEECASLQALRRGTVLTDHEDEFIRKDGTFFHVVYSSSPIKSCGNIIGLVVVFRDVTLQKQALAALHRSEALYRAMARSIPEGAISVVDSNLRYLTTEGELMARLGLSRETMEGRTVQEVFEGETGRLRAEDFRRALAGEPTSTETEYRGRIVWSQLVPLRDEQGQVQAAMSLSLDLTERKRAELELATLRDQLAAELAAMNRLHHLGTRFLGQEDLQTLLDGILDAAIAITGADKGHVQLLDTASGELSVMGQRGFDPAFVEFFSHVRAGVVACGTAMQTRQCVVVEDVTLSPLFLAEPRALQLVLAAGMRAVVCTPLLTRAGQLLGVLSILFSAPHRPLGRDLRLLDLLARQAADFIERIRAEADLRAAREDLARANAGLEEKVRQRTAKLQEALSELEYMSYSMVHDMRAPLRAMQSFATLLQAEYGDSLRSEGLDYFRRIKESANRLDRLITDALNYNKVVREQLPLTPVELGSLLRGMLETYPNLRPAAAEISLEFNDLIVLGNESLLTQCFGNLLDNATKFVAPGTKPRIRLWAEPSTLHSQPSALIYIQDNGIGIPKESQEKIFRMFQRMHRESEYPGTGIGLAIVRKAVERMGGRVGLESEPGKGSTFWIELPKAAAARDQTILKAAA